MTTREEVIAAAKEAGFRIFGNRIVAAEDGSSGGATTLCEKLYAIAYESGRQAERDQLRAELVKANTAYEVVQKDCWNLTQKVIPNLRQQLAASQKREAEALAACKAKDDLLTVLVRQYSDPIKSEYEKVLAIQPDDTALKAWIGEPVAWQSINNPLFVTSDKKVADGWQSSGYSIRNLYSSKELK